jgi:apolipoprotein D and lipocalin family protein
MLKIAFALFKSRCKQLTKFLAETCGFLYNTGRQRPYTGVKMRIKKSFNVAILVGIAALVMAFSSCGKDSPENAVAVQDFDLNNYIGKWYEIARIDFKHEKNMDNVTAEYYLNEDGSVKVINRGYDYINEKWKDSVGTAKFRGDVNEGALKVSFFGPFYSGYTVIAIDPFYQNALVAGKNYDYLWLLSRETTMPQETITRYLTIADDLGFDTDNLVWVEHDEY